MPRTNLVSADTLATHVGDDAWRPVDCRHQLGDPEAGRRAYAAGHIPGAVFAHLDDDLSDPVDETTGRHPLPSSDRFLAWCRQAGITETTTVVAYDDVGGAFAARLWWLLRDYGHDRVRILDGGLPAWQQEGYDVTTEPPDVEPSDFDAESGHMPAIDADTLQDNGVRVLDARDPPRYRGEEEPIDAKAGHIPEALNAPFKDNLTPDGTFRDPGTLRRRYGQLLGDTEADETVSYCGSGVTACHNIVAIEEAGLGTAVLYPGSWSEWIRDPDRPVRTGSHP